MYLEELTSRYPVPEAVKGLMFWLHNEIQRDLFTGGSELMIAGNGEAIAFHDAHCK